jgi:hypothetical protein
MGASTQRQCKSSDQISNRTNDRSKTMRTPSEQLVQTTWMAEHKLFQNHDAVTPVDWAKVWEVVDDIDHAEFNADQLVMVAVLEFLCGSEMVEVSLDEIANLPELERQSVVDALRLKWSRVELQENL